MPEILSKHSNMQTQVFPHLAWAELGLREKKWAWAELGLKEKKQTLLSLMNVKLGLVGNLISRFDS